MNEGYAVAKLLAHCLEKEIGEVGIFKRLLEVREARFIPRMTLQLYCSAILQSLNRVQLNERQYRSLVQRIVRCKTGNDTALVIIDIAWIHSGAAYVQNGHAKQKHIMSHRLGEIFGAILDGLCYPEPSTIVNLGGSPSPSSQELIQVLSDRVFARWGLVLSQPEFVALLAGRLRGISEASQLEYLNQVMNEVMNRPPMSLIDFRTILDNLRPQNTWDLN